MARAWEFVCQEPAAALAALSARHCWPALRKLQYIHKLMQSLRAETPRVTTGPLCTPVEQMTVPLAEHYGQRAERYREAAQGFVDDKLQEVFPLVGGRNLIPAADLLRKHHQQLLNRVSRWSGLDDEESAALLTKLEDRAEALGLFFRRQDTSVKTMDITALATSLAHDFAYTGRFTG